MLPDLMCIHQPAIVVLEQAWVPPHHMTRPLKVAVRNKCLHVQAAVLLQPTNTGGARIDGENPNIQGYFLGLS